MSFVERSIILCPYLRGSTIRGSTVYSHNCGEPEEVCKTLLCSLENPALKLTVVGPGL